MNLKNLGDERTRLGEELKRQEGLYNKLKQDIKENRLKKGVSQKEIISEYGQPVFSRVVDANGEAKFCLIWRHPTEFFSSDMLYLYFDAGNKLVLWEAKPSSLTQEDGIPPEGTKDK